MSDTLTISPHGPNGLLNTPGLGIPKRRGKGKKWGTRRKQYTYAFKATGAPGEKIAPGITRIRGNLCNVHGRYGPCDAAPKDGRPQAPGFKPKKPAKPKDNTKRDANRATVLGSSGLSAGDSALLTSLADGGTVGDGQGDALAAKGLAEQNPDGSYRLSAAGQALISAANSGDTGKAKAALAKGQEATQKRQASDAKKRTTDAARTQRQTDAKKRQAESQQRRDDATKRREDAAAKRTADQQARAAQPKPERPPQAAPKPAPKLTLAKPDKAAQQATARSAVRTQMMNSDLGLSPRGFDDFTSFADGGTLQPDSAKALTEMGLVEGNPPRLTSGGQAAVRAINSGNFRSAVDSIGKAGDDLKKAQASQADRTTRRATAAARRAAADQRRADADARRRAREAARSATKALTIFKSANGRLRWITRTTTAFQDSDTEILSTMGLDKSTQRMKATKQYGPLRWWHAGRITPEDVQRPWGPGLDLGMCDVSMRIGRTLIESGTFYDERVGHALATKATEYEISPGFLYQPDWRQPDGTFTDLIIVERSLVPVRYARASNRYTGFSVKEHKVMGQQLTDAEIAQRWAIFQKETGVSPDDLARVEQQRVAGEKTADAQRVAFKEAPTVYTMPDGTPGIIQDGHFVALKAEPPLSSVTATLTPGSPEDLAEDAADGGADEGAEGEAALDAQFVSDLTVDDLKAIFREVIQEAGGTLTEMDQKMAAMGYERKQKEATIQGQIEKLQAQLKALTDPNVRSYRPSLDGQEDARVIPPEDLEARRKQLNRRPSSGNPAEDALIEIAPDMNQLFTRNGL